MKSRLKPILRHKSIRQGLINIRYKWNLPISLGSTSRAGTIFDRLHGLDMLLNQAPDSTVLDIGCFDGLLAYHFAYNGAEKIVGIDIDPYHLNTAKRIFKSIKTPSKFILADLQDVNDLKNLKGINQQFDIVLFLGVYHHLNTLDEENMTKLLEWIDVCTKKYLAIRTTSTLLPDLKDYFYGRGFTPVLEYSPTDKIGPVTILEKKQLN